MSKKIEVVEINNQTVAVNALSPAERKFLGLTRTRKVYKTLKEREASHQQRVAEHNEALAAYLTS